MVNMTKAQVIRKMYEKANMVMRNWTRDGENEIWDMALNWNRNHEDDEIFMCEFSQDAEGNDTERVTGFMIEDDFWLYEE